MFSEWRNTLIYSVIPGKLKLDFILFIQQMGRGILKMWKKKTCSNNSRALLEMSCPQKHMFYRPIMWKLLNIDARATNVRHLESVPILRGFLSNTLTAEHLRGRSSAWQHLITAHGVLKLCYNTSFWLLSPSSWTTWSYFKISRPESKNGPSPVWYLSQAQPQNISWVLSLLCLHTYPLPPHPLHSKAGRILRVNGSCLSEAPLCLLWEGQARWMLWCVAVLLFKARVWTW